MLAKNCVHWKENCIMYFEIAHIIDGGKSSCWFGWFNLGSDDEACKIASQKVEKDVKINGFCLQKHKPATSTKSFLLIYKENIYWIKQSYKIFQLQNDLKIKFPDIYILKWWVIDLLMSILIIHASIYIQSFISRICCFCVIQSLDEYRRRLFFCEVGILFILFFSSYHKFLFLR
jgi:hypothetical protein